MRKSKMTFRRITVLLILLCVGLGLTACQKPDATSPVGMAKKIRAEVLQESEARHTVNYNGVVINKDSANLSFEIPGKITALKVSKGDKITRGQALAAIDVTDYKLQLVSSKEMIRVTETDVAQAKESLDFYTSEHKRAQTLFEQDTISQSELEKVTYAKNQASLTLQKAQQVLSQQLSQIASLQNTLDKGVLIAPVSGTVEVVHTEAGEVAGAGQPILTLSQAAKVAQVYVSTEDYEMLALGQQVEVKRDQEILVGTISYLSGNADPLTHLFAVEITLQKTDANAGELLSCTFDIGSSKGMWVPLSCIQSSSVDYVFLVADNKAVKRVVQIKEIRGDQVLVTGLLKGEMMVTQGMKSLLEGMNVTVEK